jgi:hypothetical protein
MSVLDEKTVLGRPRRLTGLDDCGTRAIAAFRTSEGLAAGTRAGECPADVALSLKMPIVVPPSH